MLFLGSAGTLSDSISLQAAGGSGFDVKCSLPSSLALYTLWVLRTSQCFITATQHPLSLVLTGYFGKFYYQNPTFNVSAALHKNRFMAFL